MFKFNNVSDLYESEELRAHYTRLLKVFDMVIKAMKDGNDFV